MGWLKLLVMQISDTNQKPRAARDVVDAYLAATRPDAIDVDAIRSVIADDITVEDPLMSSIGAEAYLTAMSQVAGAGGGASSTVQHLLSGTVTGAEVAGEAEVLAARVLFEAPGMSVQFCQWFWVAEGRISRIQVVYDPRTFLAGASDDG